MIAKALNVSGHSNIDEAPRAAAGATRAARTAEKSSRDVADEEDYRRRKLKVANVVCAGTTSTGVIYCL